MRHDVATVLVVASAILSGSVDGPRGDTPAPTAAGAEAGPGAQPDPSPDWSGLEGTLVIHDRASGRFWRDEPDRAGERFSPCSTFKIPHALIGLELGLLEGPETTFRFDRARWKREPHHSDARWRTLARDHDLRSAMRESVVWYFQTLAPQIGETRMREWLDRFEYGNRDLSSGIDTFWLGASLAVSADEQLRLLERLHDGELGSARSLAVLREILELDAGPGWRLFAKTGLGQTAGGRPLGWWVGWIEREAGPVFFAANVEGDEWDAVRDARVRVVRETLGLLGLLPGEERDGGAAQPGAGP